jgi:hypothetical protein
MNDRYYQVMNEEEWPFSKQATNATLFFSSVAGGDIVSLPSDFLEEQINGMSFTSSDGSLVVLQYAREPEILISKSSSNLASQPTHYYFPSAGKVQIYPALSSGTLSVTLNYFSTATPLDTTSSVPLIPNDFRVSTLVNGVVSDYYNFRKEPNIAVIYEGKFARAIAKMKEQQGLTDSTGNEDVRVRWGEGVLNRTGKIINRNI